MAVTRIDRGNTHWYTIDKVYAQGVTTIIDNGMPKKSLLEWAPRKVAELVADNLHRVREWSDVYRDTLVEYLRKEPDRIKDAAAGRGTKIHKIAEALITGSPVEVPEELKPYVRSLIGFMDDWGVEPILTEFTVASREHHYCATGDGVVRVRDGRVVVLDYKSGNSLQASTSLQLAAIVNAEFYVEGKGKKQVEIPMESLGIQEGVGVHIRTDGYTVYPLRIDREAFQAFLDVLKVARLVKVLPEFKGEAMEAPGV